MMSNNSLRVVLSGRILPGFDPATVQRKLIALTGVRVPPALSQSRLALPLSWCGNIA